MSELEDKLGTILSDPSMMQQILSMAQALGGSPPPQEQKPKEPEGLNLDPKLLQSLMGIMKNSQIDTDQQHLLQALSPYMSQNRVQKLEKAMKAARLASLASGFLNSGALQFITGR